MIDREEVFKQMVEVFAARLGIDYVSASAKVSDAMLNQVIEQMEFAFDNEVVYIYEKELKDV